MSLLMSIVIIMMLTISLIITPVFSFVLQLQQPSSSSLLPSTSKSSSSTPKSSTSIYSLSNLNLNLTPLPKDISPFDKSASKGCDIQGELRKLATIGLERALLLSNSDSNNNRQRPMLLELEFPPLLGGEKSKTQFDDFDNVQELNSNRDWCVEWLPTLAQSFNTKYKKVWFILPDTKEVELCKDEWKGQLYRKSALYTCIEKVTDHYYTTISTMSSSSTSSSSTMIKTTDNSSNNNNNNNNKDDTDDDEDGGYSKPWGSTFANAVNQLINGNNNKDDNDNNKDDNNNGNNGDVVDGKIDSNSNSSKSKSILTSKSTGLLLGDENSLDTLGKTGLAAAALHLVCQPGNGGPVDDWINVKKFHEKCCSNSRVDNNNNNNGNDNDNNNIGIPTIIVNGSLDKVRDGYYASFIFPKLAKTFDFYKSFEPILYLKPITDKGLYGWIFKVYNEPYQIYLQRPITTIVKNNKNNNNNNNNDTATTTTITVEDIIALVSETKPTYQECIQALLTCNANANTDANNDAMK